MDSLTLAPDEIAALGEAGAVKIDHGDRLNQIGDIWLWAYSEPHRRAEMRAAGERLSEALSALWTRLDSELSVGFIDFCELFDKAGADRETPISIDLLQSAVGEARLVTDLVSGSLEPAPKVRPKEDWILPYVCLLLLEFERLGGTSTTGSKSQQIRRNSNRDDPKNPRFLFVKKFTEFINSAFDAQSFAHDAARQFNAMMKAKTSQRHTLVSLIKKADKLREEEGQADFVKRFPVHLQSEVYAVINAE